MPNSPFMVTKGAHVMQITITERCGFLGLKKRRVTYEGGCTVWHNIETGTRATGAMERILSDLEWKKKYDERTKYAK